MSARFLNPAAAEDLVARNKLDYTIQGAVEGRPWGMTEPRLREGTEFLRFFNAPETGT